HTRIEGTSLTPNTKTLLAWTCADVFEAKGALESLCQRFSIAIPPLTMRDTAILNTGECAVLEVEGKVLAWLGICNSQGQKEFDLSARYALCEVDIDALMALGNHQVRFAPLGRFPQIERDLAVILPESTAWAQVDDVARRMGGDR